MDSPTQYSAKQLFFGGLFVPVAVGLMFAAVASANNAFSAVHPEDHHIRGAKNAKVTIVEYADFQCPFCGEHYPTLKQILKDYAGKVQMEYRHFPLSSIHPYAEKAAEASECAAEQGKFWQFHDYAFEHQSELNFDALKQWAKVLGLNQSTFNQCLDSGKYAAKVASEYAEGEQKGVQGTPATFINGELVSGAQPYAAVKAVVDKYLNAK